MSQSFYGRMRAEGYDIGTEQQELIDFYLDQWQRAGRPSPVLEPMCGTGINLIPFLEAGAEIDGLDSSPYMLEICRQKCEARGLRPQLYRQSLNEMSLPRQYGFMFIPGGSFGHVHDKRMVQQALERLWANLLPAGWLLLDLRPPASRSEFPPTGHAEFAVDERPDGSTIFTTAVWGDLDGGRVVRCWNKYEQYVDGKLMQTEIFDYLERFYEPAEFVAMLQMAGFVQIKQSAMNAWNTESGPGKYAWRLFTGRKP